MNTTRWTETPHWVDLHARKDRLPVTQRIRAAGVPECAYCGSRESLTIDHYIPRSRGGSNERENLRVACYACNQDKGDQMPEVWLASRLSKPVEAVTPAIPPLPTGGPYDAPGGDGQAGAVIPTLSTPGALRAKYEPRLRAPIQEPTGGMYRDERDAVIAALHAGGTVSDAALAARVTPVRVWSWLYDLLALDSQLDTTGGF